MLKLNELIVKLIDEEWLEKNNKIITMTVKLNEWSKSKNNWNKNKKESKKWYNYCKKTDHTKESCFIKHLKKKKEYDERRKETNKNNRKDEKDTAKDNNKKKLNNLKSDLKINFSLTAIYTAIIITEDSWLADSEISYYICKN